MKTFQERAIDLLKAMSVDEDADLTAHTRTIIVALKEQDRITRQACADNLDTLSSYHPGSLYKTYVAIDEAKESIINNI